MEKLHQDFEQETIKRMFAEAPRERLLAIYSTERDLLKSSLENTNGLLLLTRKMSKELMFWRCYAVLSLGLWLCLMTLKVLP